MSDIHASLHNELNYLGVIDGLLKNHIRMDDRTVGFGAQVGFDMNKGFPLVTSAGLKLQSVITDGVAFTKSFSTVIELLVERTRERGDCFDVFVTDCPAPINSMHLLVRGGQFDLNVQVSSVDVLHEMPALIGSLGILSIALGRMIAKAPGFLSMQVSAVHFPAEDEGLARLRLEDQITVPDRVAIKPFDSLDELTTDHVVHSNLIIKAAA